MLRLLFLSSISSLALAGCSDDACGPGSAQDAGLLASSADVVINFGNIVSGPNNDCTAPDAPSGVTSLTLQGTQVGGSGFVVLCLPRPDLLEKGPLQLGDTSRVVIIELQGDDANGCNYEIETLRPITGTLGSKGMCKAGQGLDGYALVADGSLSLKRMCPTMSDTIAVSLTGTVAVESRP